MGRILYCDDNDDILNAVKLILKSAGHNVDICKAGKACISHALDNRYDLILLDSIFTDMTAVEIISELRNKVSSSFVILSTESKDSDNMKKLGITDYIKKPFDKSELVEKISRIIE